MSPRSILDPLTMDYRREIDGLRALAVVPVILFHAGFQTFGGGFVGVDIFFVISGYLITGIILAEKDAGTFTLAGFYERRARRILPALFVVMLACLPFAWYWLLPREMKDFSESLFAVTLFLSNHLFLSETGYFATAAEAKPLLHTWSLAVEEQYYLLFPLFLILTWRFGKRLTAGLLVILSLGSLAMANALVYSKPDAAFFLLPSRAWELLIGALIAFRLFENAETGALKKQIGSAAGLMLIIYAVLFFNKATPFPGLYALVPTMGAALIILFATEKTFVGQVLGSRLLVGIGLISYSTYLWHQPLLAFARHMSPDEPSRLMMGTLATASVVLAYFTWKYVETPFRNRAKFSRGQIFSFAVAGSLFFAGVGIIGYLTKGFENRLTKAQLELMAVEKYDYSSVYRSGSCFIDSNKQQEHFADECRSRQASNEVFVWGDSHAAALSYGLRQITEVSQYTSSGCPPVVSGTNDKRPKCKQLNEFIQEEIKRAKPASIFLHANWIRYDQQETPSLLRETIRSIKASSPHSLITVIGPVPQWQPSLPAFIAKKRLLLEDINLLHSPRLEELRLMDSRLELIAKEEKVVFFSVLDALCEGSKCQATVRAGEKINLTTWDYGHLTKEGSILLSSKLFAQ